MPPPGCALCHRYHGKYVLAVDVIAHATHHGGCVMLCDEHWRTFPKQVLPIGSTCPDCCGVVEEHGLPARDREDKPR